MSKEPTLDELWNSATFSQRSFDPDQLSTFPDAVRRYLEHAISRGAMLASSVRLRMHGEIKLRGWLPFTGEEVIYWNDGMIWSATVRMFGMPIRGFDRLLNRKGAMRWKLLGIIPVVSASGLDITRSAVGRVMAESVWLPSVLAGDGVSWTAQDSFHINAHLKWQDETGELALTIDDKGRFKGLSMQRWANTEGGAFRYLDFGGVVEEEGRFAGYTIPTRLRIGWHFRKGRFEQDGEFFRVKVDDAAYR